MVSSLLLASEELAVPGCLELVSKLGRCFNGRVHLCSFLKMRPQKVDSGAPMLKDGFHIGAAAEQPSFLEYCQYWPGCEM